LIYSDLALFVLDSREGITYNDVALYKWLHYHKLRLPDPKHKIIKNQLDVSEEERYRQILEEEERFMR
jgi:predicted GTPase